MQPKPGILTSEFWLHAILQVILLLNTIDVWSYMPAKYTVIVQGILGAAYAGSRGLAKIGSPPPTSGYPVNYPPIEPPGETTDRPHPL
jgi:hypothetical protein